MVLLILSVALFISTFGIHATIKAMDATYRPVYLYNPLVLIPWVSGFILPVILLAYLVDYHWAFLAIGNAIFTYFFGPIITRMYLIRFSTGNLGKDMFYSFGLGIIASVFGMIYLWAS